MTTKAPLVTVGVPTYNRAGLLRRAIESALAQDYENLEIVISDNGSTDDTEATYRALASVDARIRYFKQAANEGAGFNFRFVLQEARGDYFMWLGDDDWLDSRYVSRCAGVLTDDVSYRLVAGVDRYDEAGRVGQSAAGAPQMIEAGCSFNSTQIMGAPGIYAVVSCPAGCAQTGGLWGTDVYTGDSAICRAGVHAGVISDAGVAVGVLLDVGQPAYRGTARNGVRSNDYGAYRSSFRLQRP